MKFIELSEENFEKLRTAQRAVTKIDFGGFISPNSSDHAALTWAIVSLTAEMMFDNKPLTDKERKQAEEIAKEIVAESIHDDDDDE